MKKKRWNSMGLWARCLLVLPGLIAATLIVKFGTPTPKVILWSDIRYGDPGLLPKSERQIRVTEDMLSGTMLPEIDFDEVPLSESIESLVELIREHKIESSPFRVVFDDSIEDRGEPVSLQLENVRAADGLYYLLGMGGLKYMVMNDGHVLIVPPCSGVDQELEWGWFEPAPSLFSHLNNRVGSVDVRKELEDAGIGFAEGALAEYHPDKQLLRVKNSRDQMELIDAYTASFHCHSEPIWRDKVYHYWMLVSGADATPPASPASTTRASSPVFGPDPLWRSTLGFSCLFHFVLLLKRSAN